MIDRQAMEGRRRDTPARVLICTNHLINFAGSEIHCLEMAQYFTALGHDVLVAANNLGPPIEGEFKKIGIPTAAMGDLGRATEFDIVWTHHVPCFRLAHLVKKLRARKFVHGILSVLEPMELPPFKKSDKDLEGNLTVLANAPVTKDFIEDRIGTSFRVQVLRNFAPQIWQDFVPKAATELKKILIVSNHIPDELEELTAHARQQAITMEPIGLNADRFARVTPELVAGYDAVISIGKTVQYCLTGGIPVFIYDYFGGPGWLSDANIDAAEYSNYNGKCTGNRRPAEKLLRELTEGFSAACAFANTRRGWAASRYGIGEQLDRLGVFDLADAPFALMPRNSWVNAVLNMVRT